MNTLFNQKVRGQVLLWKISLIGIFIFSLNYFCDAQPLISSFSPTSGGVGTSVSITGSNFSSIPANNLVFFGAVKANVSSAASNKLTVTVPFGATYQQLTVTVNGLTAYSQKPFIVTFPISSDISSNSFAQSIDSTTDLHPNDLVMADFDGDGKPDLATANNYSTAGSLASVSVLRNTSSGGAISFATHQDIFTGVQTFALAAGDLDGDGKPDMISCSIVDKTISVFRNTSTTGVISFAAKTDYAVGENPYDIAIGDLDGDGRPDIVVTNYLSNSISIFRNTSTVGNISFATKVDISTGSDLGPWGIAVQDLDGDGKPDLAVTNNLSNTVSIFRNKSTGTNISFAPSIHYYGGVAPMGIAIGDMDGDGKPDLVWAKDGDNTAVGVELNQSSPGALSFVATPAHTYNITYAYNVAISDINGDGNPDLLLSSYGKISVLQNASTVGNISLSPIADFQGNSPYALAAGDINGDGYADFVTTNFTSNSVSIYKNQLLLPSIISFSPTIASQGTIDTITGNNFTGATAVSFGGVAAASFTVVNNNTITAVVGSGEGGEVKVTNAYGSGSMAGFTFTGPPSIKSFTPVSADSGVVVTLTGINFIEVTGVSFGGTPAVSFQVISPTVIAAVAGNGTSGDITVTNNYGTGSIPGFVVAQPAISSFTPVVAGRRDTVTITGTNFSAVSGVSFGGTDAISFDIVSPTQIRAVVRGGKSGEVSVKTVRTVNRPGFIFVLPPAPVIDAVTPDSGQIGSVVTIAGNNFSNTAPANNVFFGAAKATVLSAAPTLLTVKVPVGVTHELISFVNSESQLTGTTDVFFNVTQPVIGTIDSTMFAKPVILTNPNQQDPGPMVLCDFNNDGKIDIAGETRITLISVRKNTSTKKKISFDNGIIVPIGGDGGGTNSTDEIRVADMDGDGKKDLVAIKYTPNDTNYISVFRNISTTDSIMFAPAVEFKSLVNTSNILVVDIDGDGRMDIIVQGDGLSFPASASTLILRNTSSGAGDISFENSSYSIGTWVGTAVCADFDGDGKPDIVSGYSLAMYCSRNTSTPGNISFAPPFPIYYAPVSDHVLESIVVGDIDGDGKNDLFIVNSGTGSGGYAILRNTSSGANISFAVSDFLNSVFPNVGTLHDMDGDGKPDLTFGGLIHGNISICKNTSSPGIISFAPDQLYTPLTLSNMDAMGRTLAIGDFDGDNKPDIVLGEGESSTYLEVLRNQADELSVSENSVTRFCEGGQITLHSSLRSGNQWYKDGVIIPGASVDSLIATMSGSYSDTVTIQCVKIFTDSSITITVIPTPAKPGIGIGTNNELISSSLAGNQWFNDNGAISGATDSIYLPSSSKGNYRVQVTINGCVSPMSDIYKYIGADSSNPVRIIPNPVMNSFRIFFNFPNINSVKLALYTMNGEKLFELPNVYSGYTIPLWGYHAGSYIVRLIDPGNNKVLSSKQIIKL